MALTDNLVSYWKLDESSGDAADSVGDNDLTNNGTVTYSSGVINNGAALASSSSQNLIVSDPLIAVNSDVSYSFWVKHTTVPGNGEIQQWMIHEINGDNDIYQSLMLQKTVGGIQQIQIYIDGTSAIEDYYNSSIATDTWYHIVLTIDYASGYVLYINGSSVKTGSAPAYGSGDTLTSRFSLGVCWFLDGNNYGRYFNGMMDEVGIWSRVLTSDEVVELYNSGDGLAYPFADTSFTPIIIQF
jgi:hypothetical protein